MIPDYTRAVKVENMMGEYSTATPEQWESFNKTTYGFCYYLERGATPSNEFQKYLLDYMWKKGSHLLPEGCERGYYWFPKRDRAKRLQFLKDLTKK